MGIFKPQPASSDTFTTTDRCDRCGAQATHRYYIGITELLFCAHHERQHHDKLTRQGGGNT